MTEIQRGSIQLAVFRKGGVAAEVGFPETLYYNIAGGSVRVDGRGSLLVESSGNFAIFTSKEWDKVLIEKLAPGETSEIFAKEEEK